MKRVIVYFEGKEFINKKFDFKPEFIDRIIFLEDELIVVDVPYTDKYSFVIFNDEEKQLDVKVEITGNDIKSLNRPNTTSRL